jgi:tetratricopeptide (TPR) repeat protein
MNRIKSSLIPAALAAATLGLGTAASANPHLKVCLDPTVSAQTLADFCQRAVDFGFLSDEQEAAALTNIGVGLSELGRHGDALAAYDKAVARKPDFFAVYPNRALAREKQGQVKGALDDYAVALRLRPRDVGSLIGRGALYLKRGVADLALKDFEAAARADRSSLDAQYNLGLAHLALGRPGEAASAFTAALRIDPNDAYSHYQRGVALRAIDPAGAERDLARAIELRPQWAEPHVARGEMRDAAGDREAANADFRRAFELGYKAEWLNQRINEIGG